MNHFLSFWIEQQLRMLGYEMRRQRIVVDTNVFLCPTGTAYNIEAVLPGRRNPTRNIVIGAHYDTKVAFSGSQLPGDHTCPPVRRYE